MFANIMSPTALAGRLATAGIGPFITPLQTAGAVSYAPTAYAGAMDMHLATLEGQSHPLFRVTEFNREIVMGRWVPQDMSPAEGSLMDRLHSSFGNYMGVLAKDSNPDTSGARRGYATSVAEFIRPAPDTTQTGKIEAGEISDRSVFAIKSDGWLAEATIQAPVGFEVQPLFPLPEVKPFLEDTGHVEFSETLRLLIKDGYQTPRSFDVDIPVLARRQGTDDIQECVIRAHMDIQPDTDMFWRTARQKFTSAQKRVSVGYFPDALYFEFGGWATYPEMETAVNTLLKKMGGELARMGNDQTEGSERGWVPTWFDGADVLYNALADIMDVAARQLNAGFRPVLPHLFGGIQCDRYKSAHRVNMHRFRESREGVYWVMKLGRMDLRGSVTERAHVLTY